MAWFCYQYRMTPTEYKALKVYEHKAMIDVLKDIARERRKSANKSRAR